MQTVSGESKQSFNIHNVDTPSNLSLEHIVQIVNTVADPIFVKDNRRCFVLVNDALCDFVNHPREALIGKSDYDFFPKEEADVFWEKDTKVFNTTEVDVNEEYLTDAEGNTKIIITKKRSFTDHNGQQFLVGVIRDITEHKLLQSKLEKSLEKLSYQARFDHLTGLLNRYEFNRSFEQLLNSPLDEEHVLLVLDLDNFKAINDNGGHLLGDQLLQEVSYLIQSVTRKTDVVCRMGGDEFAVILHNCSILMAEKAAEKIISAVSQHHIQWKNKTLQVGISIGLALIKPSKVITPNDVIKRADAACYVAKSRGKNQFYTTDLDL